MEEELREALGRECYAPRTTELGAAVDNSRGFGEEAKGAAAPGRGHRNGWRAS
jgi:hypothetical protein